MKRYWKSVAVALGATVLILSQTVAHAADIMDEILQRGELRVGVQTQGEPVSFVDKNGDRTGLAIDIVEMMAQDLGVKLVLQDYDWKGLIPGLLGGKFDLIAADMTPTPERTAALLFSKPFFYQQTVAYTTNDKPYKSWEELNQAGLNIGAVQGGTYVTAVKEFLPKATVKEFASGPTVAQALSAGRIDGALSDLGNVRGYAKVFDNLKLLDGVITREPLAFATRKENIQLKFWMDNYVELISANHKLDKLLDYWWNTTDWQADHK